jgi:16S rRNA (uracil1498-N3)-methyltransferase
MANRYLDEHLSDAVVGGRVSVSGPEARHAVTVSRLKAGERVSVGNGAGLIAEGEVVSAEAGAFEFVVDAVSRVERDGPAVILAQALAKGDRDELAIQAATELGVDAVIPWSAARSISRWEGAKVAKGIDRWMAVVREATKQSMRAWLPDVLDLVTTKQLALLGSETRLLVLDPTASTPLSALVPDGRDLLLVAGPEGGIAPEEFAALGGERVRLGPEVLRTSTAGPAAIAVLNVALGRW